MDKGLYSVTLTAMAEDFELSLEQAAYFATAYTIGKNLVLYNIYLFLVV